jgi:hypothetical protein
MFFHCRTSEAFDQSQLCAPDDIAQDCRQTLLVYLQETLSRGPWGYSTVGKPLGHPDGRSGTDFRDENEGFQGIKAA